MANNRGSWKSALTPQKAPTYGNQAMLIASPKELQLSCVDYVVVFEGTKKYHVAMADVVNPFTLHVTIPEHDVAEEVVVTVHACGDKDTNILTNLKFSYVSQMEHAIAKLLAQSVADVEFSEKLDAVWTVCLGREHLEFWDRRLAQAFAQLELPIEWTLVGDILQNDNESHATLLHFAARHGLKELIGVFLDLPGAKRALSTCNKSGLLPRDVARENGRLDLVELLDSERVGEQRRLGPFKDGNRRRVRRNNDSGVATITNNGSHNIREDIQLLRELNKRLAKTKKNLPVNRHSWPINAILFDSDGSVENLDDELYKILARQDLSAAKDSFKGDNLALLRDIAEEVCQLRLKNIAQMAKEISVIADENRRPAHLRRLSCPAEVERRKLKGRPNVQFHSDSKFSDQPTHHENRTSDQVPRNSELRFSTPPHSPTVDELGDLRSNCYVTPVEKSVSHAVDDVIEPFEFMTPRSNSPTSSPLPPSPLPISLKYSDAEKRINPSRRDRPRTWYGGPADAPPEENELRRSNSLEDFAKIVDDGSDDESASEANSKGDLLQTMSSFTEKASRTESFVSSISDLSVEKASDGSGSDIECEQGDECEREEDVDTQEVIEDIEATGGHQVNEELPEVNDSGNNGESGNVEVREEMKESTNAGESGGTDVYKQVEESGNTGESGDIGVYEEMKRSEDTLEKVEDEENCEIKGHAEIRNVEVHHNPDEATGFDKSSEEKQELDISEGGQLPRVENDEEMGISCEDDVDKEPGHQNEDEVKKTEENDVEASNSMEVEDVKEDVKEAVKEDVKEAVKEDVKEDVKYVQNSVRDDDEESDALLNDHEDKEGGKESIVEDNQRSDVSAEVKMDNDEHGPDLTEKGEKSLSVEKQDNIASEIEMNYENQENLTDVEDEKGACENHSDLGDMDISTKETEETLSIAEEKPSITEEKPSIADDRSNDSGTREDEEKSTEVADESSLSDTIITFNGISDAECEVKDFCLPGQISNPNKQLFRVQATDDVESGEDSDREKHRQFEEKAADTVNPSGLKEPKNFSEDTFPGEMFRQRSALLLKIPVKRSGSDVSVTSLQDVQLDIHSGSRDGTISPGALAASRKAKSYGDLSTYSLTEVSNNVDDESDEERRRIVEDQAQLADISRIKKLESAGRYASTETLDQISNSRVIAGRDVEDPSKRRWSNFFTPRNPKPTKKPGRTPTFRRDTLRSSMSSIGKSAKSGKNTIESLVSQHATAFVKHSQTLPNSSTSLPRPRSYTRDSPGAVRRSPTVISLDTEEPKAESPEDYQPDVVTEDLVFDIDSDLENFEAEPEAWSVTVEKKVLKKMSKNEIKRQDVILELIQTEGHHVRTLKIMQQVFYRGLNRDANYSSERLDELFPRINDLVDLSSRFYRNLRCRQDENASVQKIGDVIVKHFSGDSAELVKEAYGEFVSKNPESLALYKQFFKTDKKFSNFIKKCHGHRIVRRLSIPECYTLVVQRMTKYPILIETILKATKSSSSDYKELQKALLVVKDALKAVDNAIKDYEKQSRLKDIKVRMERGSVVVKSGEKIKNSRFVDYNSKMIHDGVLQWKSARGKLTETHVVLLESMVAFLVENDKKFSLLSIDGKSPCISLKTLMVREVATDKCAIYFVSTSKKGPEMYEFVCSSQKEKRQWCSIIQEAISKAPEDTGDLFHSPEEEKKLAEERLKRRDEILEIMKGKDKELSDLVEEKNRLVAEMKELRQVPDGNGKVKENERITSNEKARSILLTAIHRTTQLTADTIQLHESHSDSELAAVTCDKKASSPKRSETFGGFDRRPSQKGSRRATTTIPEGKLDEHRVSQRRDSGLSLASGSVVGLNTLSQAPEVAGSSSFQMLEALQWVLVQFSKQETALETLQVELQSTKDEMKRLRAMKLENDKKQFLVKEEHQAELTRQKKAYSDLEKTFNKQVADLKLKLTSQQEQQADLLKNFSELREALTRNK